MKLENLIAVFLDSCRYDSFMLANKPNIDSLNTEIYKAYSPAAWTLPAMFSYSVGVPPLNTPIKYRKELFLSRQGEGLGDKFNEKYFLTPNPLILNNKHIFKAFNLIKGLEYDYCFSCDKIFQDAVELINSTNENFCMFILLMETHSPYWDGKSKYHFFQIPNQEEFLKIQAKSVEVVDTHIKQLFDVIPNNTRLIITADHGELFDEKDGKMLYHHNLTKDFIEFHPKLFEIPLVIKDFM